MKTLKQLLTTLLALAMVLALAACGGSDSGSSSGDSSASDAGASSAASSASETSGEDTSAVAGAYAITYNMNNDNLEDMPTFTFVNGSFNGLLAYDARCNQTITLTLGSDGTYELTSDAYCEEAGERCTIGDGTGVGFVMIATYTGTFTDNGDGTVTIDEPTYGTYELEYDTYSIQMAAVAYFSLADDPEEYGTWTSDDMPQMLELVPVTTFTLDGDAIVTYTTDDPGFQAEEEDEGDASSEAEAEETGSTSEAEPEDEGDDATADLGNVLLEIASDDEGTSFTLYDSGSYQFYFASYEISDIGTYTYADGVLTITDANGAVTESTTDGDNVVFHYEYSQSDQLTGDYTVAVSDLEAALN